MKTNLYLILIILLFTSCKSQNPKAEMPLFQLSDSTYISKTDSSILLPTRYFLSDSIAFFPEDIIAASDCILPANSFREKPDTIHLKGDTLYRKGSEVPKDEFTYIKYDTEVVLKNNGIYIYSPRMLERCQINIEYTEPAIYNKILGSFSSRSNRSVDFFSIQSQKYVYYAPFTTWENGGFGKFDNMKIMYEPERREGYTFGMFDNTTTFNKADFETYFPQFKAYLIQK